MKLNVSRKQFEKEIRELRKSLNDFLDKKRVVMMNWRRMSRVRVWMQEILVMTKII